MAVISFDKARGVRQKETTHSKKLEFIIRDFISRCGHGYYDDELDKGILKNYFYLNESVSIEQKIIIRENDCICYSTLSLTLKLTDKLYDTRLLALLVELNDINFQLDYGNFEYDMETGDIRFRTSYEPNEGIICSEDLDKFLGYPRFIINKYGERIAKAIHVWEECDNAY